MKEIISRVNMSDADEQHEASAYPGGLGAYKLYACHSKSGGRFKATSVFSFILIMSSAVVASMFSIVLQTATSKYADIIIYIKYNGLSGTGSPEQMMGGLETTCVCACLMSGIIIFLSMWTWYCSYYMTRVQRYRFDVATSFLILVTSWIMGWTVFSGAIANIYDLCHSHQPTVSDVTNPAYSLEGYTYLCKQGNDRAGIGNFFNVVILIVAPVNFLSNWCGKIFGRLKGVQSINEEQAFLASQKRRK